ncbi:efflux RND transporter periplasmic adaptor subunit, partial [Elusimicrobiota bacterium]
STKIVLVVYILIMAPLIAYSIVLEKKKALQEKLKETETQEVYMPMVKVFDVQKSDYNDTLSVMGTLKGSSEVELKFEISGRIASFNFREGDEVSAGEIIVSLDSEDVMTKLRHSKSKLESVTSKYMAAKEKMDLYRELYQMGAIIEVKMKEMELNVQSLKADVDSAKSERELAESQLEKTVTPSPADGVMGSKFVEVGDFVTPNDVVGTFLEVTNVFVEVGIIEKDIIKVNVDQKVKVKFDAHPDDEFWGRVDNVSKMVRGETRSLPVKIIISNPGRRLLSGMLAECDIYMRTFEDTIMIPSASIINLGEMKVVPLIKPAYDNPKEGIVELRQITTGYESSDYTQITDGLDSGNIIVVETQQPLKDGMQVKIIEVIKGTWN